MTRSSESSPQIGILPRLKSDIHEISRTVTIGIDRNILLKTGEKAQEALDSLAKKGLINEDYPQPKNHKDIERLIDLKLLAQNLERSLGETLADNSINRVLSISPTSRCEANCVHCCADSKPKGNDLDYAMLERSDPDFFKIFKRVHFGFEGNSLLASGKDSAGRPTDLADYITLLYKFGIKNFVIDTKTIDDKTLNTYRRIKEFFRTTKDVSLTQRISFNLYSPHIYKKENPLDDLKAEFLPLLDEALDFAQEVVIVSTGSFKYTNAHIFKTMEYLCKIMEENGFYTIRQHFGKVLYRDIPADREEYLLRRKYLERNVLTSGSRKDMNIEPMLELIGIMAGTPKDIDLIPTFFVHKDTEKIVDLIHANTTNEGRWKNVKDKGEVYMKDRELPTTTRSICAVFLTDNLFLDSNGKIYSCPGAYHASVPIGNISQSWQELFANMQSAHEKTSELYKQNIKGVVNGTFNNWRCGMER